MYIFHDIFTTRLEISKERDLIANLLKVIQSQVQTYRSAKKMNTNVALVLYSSIDGTQMSILTLL